MKGVYTAIATVAVLIALMLPMRASAQALPELPAETLATLELVQGQLQNTMLNSNGLQVYQDATSSNLGSLLLLFEGLHQLNQAYQDFQTGVTNGFQVLKAEEVQENDLPDGLTALEQAGKTYSWELEYFGHRVTMLTDEGGRLRTFQDGNKKALNVTAKNEMQTAIDQLKAQAQDRKHVAIAHGNTNYTNSQDYPSYNDLKQPVIQGKNLIFWITRGNIEYQVRIENFVNATIEMPVYHVFYNGYLMVSAQDVSNISLYVNNEKKNGSTLNNRLTSTIFNNLTQSLSFQLFPSSTSQDYSNMSFKMPLNYQNNMYHWNNGYTVNTDANIQGMYLGQTIPIGSAKQMYITVGAIQEVEGYPQTPAQIIGKPISAQSLQDIQDAIAQIQPQTDPETGIEILPVPQEFPLPEALPLESEEPAPPIPPGIEDFPSSDPSQVPAQNPNVEPSTTPTEDTLPDSAEQIQPMEELQLVTGLQNRFPFSIPWDIYNAYRMLQAEKEPPEWTWDMVVNLPTGGVFTHTFTLSMEPVDSLVTLFRDLFLLAFILGLAIYSYNKFFGGGA